MGNSPDPFHFNRQRQKSPAPQHCREAGLWNSVDPDSGGDNLGEKKVETHVGVSIRCGGDGVVGSWLCECVLSVRLR